MARKKKSEEGSFNEELSLVLDELFKLDLNIDLEIELTKNAVGMPSILSDILEIVKHPDFKKTLESKKKIPKSFESILNVIDVIDNQTPGYLERSFLGYTAPVEKVTKKATKNVEKDSTKKVKTTPTRKKKGEEEVSNQEHIDEDRIALENELFNASLGLAYNFSNVFDLTEHPELKKSLDSNGGVPRSTSDFLKMVDILDEQFPAMLDKIFGPPEIKETKKDVNNRIPKKTSKKKPVKKNNNE